MDDRGLFIVLEGSDGSGKTTQFKLLAERLKAVGHDVAVFDFPRYDEASSHFIKRYLNGDYGPASEISPYTASLFYALDRYEAAPDIRKALTEGKVVLSNRYVGSNMAHQGSKFGTSAEQRGFFLWEESLEYQLLSIPRPAINIFLRVPAETAFKLIGQKSARTYTVSTRDEHEKDIGHLKKTVQTYDLLCHLFTKDFKAIECAPKGRLLKVTDISDLIWQELKPLLPPPMRGGRKRVVRLESTVGPTAKSDLPAARKASLPKLNKIETLKFDVQDVSLLVVSEIMSSDNLKVVLARSEGKPDFYAPVQLSKEQSKNYRGSMNKIFDINFRLKSKLPRSAVLRSLLPLATLADVQVKGSAGDIQNLMRRLEISELAESRKLADRLQKSLKSWLSVQTSTVERIRPASDEKRHKNMRHLADSHLPHGILRDDEAIRLLEVWPRNEFELLADSLYPLSDLARDDIVAALDKMTFAQKQEALASALDQDANLVLGRVHYRFDVLADMLTLQSIYDAGMAYALQLQKPTVRYGFKTPKQIQDSEVDELFANAFDESFKLYSDLQSGHLAEAESYAVLLGHRQRWQFATSAASVWAYLKSDQRTGDQALNAQLAAKIAESHPQISEFMNRPRQPVGTASKKAVPDRGKSGVRTKSKKTNRRPRTRRK